MSDGLGFRITAEGCAWVCDGCGKEFPSGGTLHLCDAKLPEEYARLRASIATLEADLKNEHTGRMLHEDLHDRWRTRATELEALLATANEKARYCADETKQALVDLAASREREAAAEKELEIVRSADSERNEKVERKLADLKASRERWLAEMSKHSVARSQLKASQEREARNERQAEVATLGLEGAARRIAQLGTDLAAERERSAALALIIAKEHGPDYVPSHDLEAILAAHDAEVERKAKALEGYLGYLDQGSGSELAWPELRRRIAALKAEGGQ